jgi:hypothetical protein
VRFSLLAVLSMSRLTAGGRETVKFSVVLMVLAC